MELHKWIHYLVPNAKKNTKVYLMVSGQFTGADRVLGIHSRELASSKHEQEIFNFNKEWFEGS